MTYEVTWTDDDPPGSREAGDHRDPARPGVRVVRLASPPANALGPAVLDGLDAAIRAAAADGVRVLVVASGRPGFFAAGADIKHLDRLDAATFTAYGDAMRAVNDRLAAAPFLSVAAVDGPALGGGLELALACTMRVAGPQARFGVPEVKLGLIPGAGGTQRLPRLVGRGRALDLVLTARQVPPVEAHAMGLVDRVTDGDVVAAATRLATELGAGSLAAQLAAVRAVDAACDRDLADGVTYERELIGDLFTAGDAAEGLAAFVAKRKPVFR